jgi:broad specificity phosphatase PhoE
VVAVHVFLLRHGETALNAAGLLRGRLDIPLNTTGEAEAAALGEVFSQVPLSAVVSSPLRRAADTARRVASASAAPLKIDERLSDRFYGEWTGHSLEDVEGRFGSIDAAPVVEAWHLLRARAEEAFFDAVATAGASGAATGGGKTGVALVTHDAVLRALLGRLLPALSSAKLDLPTGSWSELVSSTGGRQWRAAHLGELPASTRRPALQPG